jgi:hypothetical protein
MAIRRVGIGAGCKAGDAERDHVDVDRIARPGGRHGAMTRDRQALLRDGGSAAREDQQAGEPVEPERRLRVEIAARPPPEDRLFEGRARRRQDRRQVDDDA